MAIQNSAQTAEFPDGGKMVAYPMYLVDSAGNPGINGSTQQGIVAAGVGTSPAVVKASSGYLSGVLVTATGSANLLLYDNATAASGVVIGVVPSSASLGQYFPCNMPARNGITAGTVSGSPAVTVAYS